jgi:hypothetical protein
MPLPTLLDFDRGTDTSAPLTVFAAVRRGHAVITRPVLAIILVVMAASYLLGKALGSIPILLATPFVGPLVGWVWWSYAIPQWRDWAHRRGVDPARLQEVAVREWLVWPKGHFFERTEFRRRQ